MREFIRIVCGLMMIGVIISTLIFFTYCIVMHFSSRHRMIDAAAQTLRTNTVVAVNDSYGNACKVNLQRGEQMNVVVVHSAGYDGEFDTTDDIIIESIDYNKSRIVGKWVGQKTKQGLKGFIEGFRSQSKHE